MKIGNENDLEIEHTCITKRRVELNSTELGTAELDSSVACECVCVCE